MFPFYTLKKHQNVFSFLVFSGGIKWEYFAKNRLINKPDFWAMFIKHVSLLG